MTTTSASTTDTRTPLSRERILHAALDYIDQHGLEALSMHKLGAALGVKGMSLYNHVANKDDVLDGVVDVLWAEVENEAPPDADWRAGYRRFAHALRDTMHRHPKAAALIGSRQVMPEPALRCVQAHIAAAVDGGLAEERAYALLRTINSYALGYAFALLSWGLGGPGCAPSISHLLRPGTSDELAGVAEVFCGQSDPDAEFELGLSLMLASTEPD
ncbi:TetR/AcrR family transcriptional regulator [Phytoactinopolyspora halotolerans]|uniref:TetR/AcrR family transcriptional regulator n=1 Tax=Phytoactinopolyspora halotolerans TaxID=1981512 RepID=A0A6L9SC73_9ACTN|nr:TetR/AcrR family transcriptional regulator C-terminal domain-containing protein [Phytoactinopolyspora halotolerans]NEE02609.1 TetR/AcrR family transcriptional regulator [Phytoactinopolyspora halotolerans]